MTAITPAAPPDTGTAQERAEFLAAVADLAAACAAPGGASLEPGNIPVSPGPRGRRLHMLDQIAEALGVPVVHRDGKLVAERELSGGVLEAHVCDEEPPGAMPAFGVMAAAAVRWCGNIAPRGAA